MAKNSNSIRDREFNKFSVKNGRRVVNTDSPSVRTTQFGESLSVKRDVLFSVKANVPSVSLLRNFIENTGTADVSVDGGEFMLTAPAGSKALLESAERGRYLPGYEAQAGIGIRLPEQTFTGDSYFKWGYFQGSDGFGFGKDADGIFVFSKKDSVETRVPQSEWTVDKMNGNGPSGVDLDLKEGLIFHIDYAWYGYSAVEFSVQVKSANPDVGDYMQEVHRFAPSESVSITQPNLFIAAELNNDNDPELTSYVGGRQYSVYGDFIPQSRIASEFVINKAVTDEWTPLITFKRKNASLAQLAQSCRVLDTTVASPDDLIFGYIFDGTLTGATFGTPSNMTATETVLESDVAATAITGGISIGPKELTVGGSGNRSGLSSESKTTFDMVNDKPLTLVARSVGATGTVRAATFNMTEEW